MAVAVRVGVAVGVVRLRSAVAVGVGLAVTGAVAARVGEGVGALGAVVGTLVLVDVAVSAAVGAAEPGIGVAVDVGRSASCVTAAAAHHLEQPAARMMVVDVAFEVLVDVVDPRCEDRYLHFR